jgi:hypothetical protein
MSQVEKLTQAINAINPIKSILIMRLASEGGDGTDSTMWNNGSVQGLQWQLLLHGTSKFRSKSCSIGYRSTVTGVGHSASSLIVVAKVGHSKRTALLLLQSNLNVWHVVILA